MSASQPTPPTTAASDSMQHLKSLINHKTALEAQIEALSSTGSSAQLGQSLVDADGFPRADVDVHGARIARQSLAQLQTDHVAVMKQIETAMFALHAEAKRNKLAAQQSSPAAPSTGAATARPATDGRIQPVQEHKQPQQPSILSTHTSILTPPTTTTPPTPTAPPTRTAPTTTAPMTPPVALSPHDAFLLVDQLLDASPAQSAGLCVGDRVIQFGSVVRVNYSKEAMRGVVGNSVGRGVRVVVDRAGQGMVALQLVPQRWSGQGLLGCHLADI